MRFFTRAWAKGDMPEEAWEAIPEAYEQHLGALDLPATVAQLAAAYLHDAHVLDVEDEPKRLRLRLRTGDLQFGYSDLEIVYTGSSTDSATLGVLLASDSEVLYSELDRRDTRFEHRLLFWPEGEAAIEFDDVRLVSHPVPSRDAP